MKAKKTRNAGKSKTLNIKELQDKEEMKAIKSMLEHEDESGSESDETSQDEGYETSGSRLSKSDETRFGRSVLLPNNGRTSKKTSFNKTEGTKPILYSKSKFKVSYSVSKYRKSFLESEFLFWSIWMFRSVKNMIFIISERQKEEICPI